MFSSFQAVRAEALFLSCLQCSQSPGAEEVRAAVTATLRRFGTRDCAARVAAEFGDHPDTAAPRMAWALAMVRAAYPARHAGTPRPAPHRLALAA
jgi:hypothetical protein